MEKPGSDPQPENEVKKPAGASWIKTYVFPAAFALLVFALAVSVGSFVMGKKLSGTPNDFSARFAGYEVANEPNGDLSKVIWPSFVTEAKAGPEVKELYEFQIQNGDLMKYMPCFCGCGQQELHRSNRDCFVKAVNADGSVVLDEMAPT